MRGALEPGALVPSPAGTNVARRDDVRDVLAGLLGDKVPAGGTATLVLPDGIARMVVAEPPTGAEPRDYLRFRMASSLPWAASDAIVDVLPVGRGRVVGVAVRRATVAQYEQLAISAGLTVERVHLAPLVALRGLLGRGGRGSVHAILGDVAVCLALIWEGGVAALRSRRRDASAGEGARLLAEAARTVRQAGDRVDPSSLTLSGAGATRLRDELGHAAHGSSSLDGPRAWPEAAEAAWLGGMLA